VVNEDFEEHFNKEDSSSRESSNHSTPGDYIICGRFGSSHGVRGAIKVFSETEPKEALLDYQPWWIKTADGWQALEFSNPKVAAKYLLVTPKDCTDCDMVRRYVNQDIAILRSQFPETEDGTYYWTDLIGCEVTNHDGSKLGKVIDIYDQHGTDVFIVEDSKKNRTHIPHLEPFIQSIDIEAKQIKAHWEIA
jgi:16S rRNA processing protein RimM